MTAGSVRHDRLTTRLVELDSIRTVLVGAADRLADGWLQGDWSADAGLCLVASIRAGSTGQLRARAIDVCWHARYGDAPGSAAGLDRVPPPGVRSARIRDLTRWNDETARRVDEVVDLLHAAGALAAAEMERVRGLLGTQVVTREHRLAS